MDLLIVRHAKAEPGHPDGDAARRLTDRGHRQAKRLGAFLESAFPRPDRILASPFVRARQTARHLADALGVALEEDETLAAGMQPEEACALLRESPAQEARVLLVGHNPDLEALVSYLLETSAAGIEMKTASLAHITADPPARGRGLLRALVPVKRIEQG